MDWDVILPRLDTTLAIVERDWGGTPALRESAPSGDLTITGDRLELSAVARAMGASRLLHRCARAEPPAL